MATRHSSRNAGASGGGGGIPDGGRTGGRSISLTVKREALYGDSGSVGSAASGSGRPQRGAGQRAAQQLHIQAEDEDEDDDDEEEGEDEIDGGEDEGHLDIGDEGRRRSSRDRKPAQRYAEVEEVSPVLGARTGRGGRTTRRRVADPDSDGDGDGDGDEGGDYAAGRGIPSNPPRKSFPPRQSRNSMASAPIPELPIASVYANGLGNGRATRSKAHVQAPATPSKSRNSSADAESFQPDQSGGSGASDIEGGHDGSDDPLARDYVEDDDDDEEDDGMAYGRRTRSRGRRVVVNVRSAATNGGGGGLRRSTRTQPARHDSDDDEEAYGGRPKRNLRTRAPVNYQLPPADISTEIRQAELVDSIQAASRPNGAARAGGGMGMGLGGARGGGGRGVRFGPKGSGGWAGGLGGGLAGMAGGADSSDSDDLLPPLKASTSALSGTGGPSGGVGLVGGPKVSAPTDVKDFGRINPKSSTADADPLGVDMNVTFDNVGGLDGHIDQLKEMVALPLLYPEVFQQFGITPPRGVLFHGPPGTGKTLLARALAASCSNGNTKISFFMRKGADVLSKWVGEAERQLRMLFEEARAAQPSIIFFDEIDGLAPVRSSKQDQIHASLVSTLLALMDGMDGRGQVIVIGATNRPDSVDPALRRPGRFDREFYFPLPNKEARKKIIKINTRVWDPPLEEGVVEMLAGATKGYGGADMRALCTEAALNAIQRRYPQIYKSSDRYLLDTGSIRVQAKDFLMSVKKIVPSSARSTTSTAVPLAPHLVPLLSAPLDRLKKAVDEVLPRHKSTTALEEAMWEEDGAGFEGAEILQNLDKMRTYRPRLLVTGQSGMGQAYLGPAILHHLEGFHVQNFDLGVLLGDSSRTVEAALVQLFIEAKRHQPSILYIPSLVSWSATLSDSAKSTFKSLLDGIAPSEPVLLLGVAETENLDGEVRSWFGWEMESEVMLELPTEAERTAYFAPLLAQIALPPSSWPDALPRRPRVLEQLPLAPPLPARLPTEAEVAKERERDLNARNMMVLSFTSLVAEFGRKYKRIVLSVKEDAFVVHAALVQRAAEMAAEAAAAPAETDPTPPAFDIAMSSSQPLTSSTEAGSQQTSSGQALFPTQTSSAITDLPSTLPTTTITATTTPSGPDWTPHDVDTDTLARRLAKHKYCRPSDFLADVDKIKANADKLGDVDRQTKVAELVSHAYLHVAEFDPRWMPEFDAYAERMQKRREDREKLRSKEKEGDQGEKEVEVVDKGKKRAREDGEDVEMTDGVQDGHTEKRVRVEGEGETSTQTSSAETPAIAVEPQESSLSVPTSGSASESGPSVPAPMAGPSSQPVPPAPVYPDFVLPADKFRMLREALTRDTKSFTIEELEHLRAGLFGRIWKARGEWDREQLIVDCARFLEKTTRGVSGRREA
ncbi:putative TAT-binding protein [Dioszegia hungarica]|uniref:TAT-binding protein n=1 Tax=Dioszegia hungarica TaxID=4972 RepID=A0AA38LQM8_9TREE|nr:putative TAT-binding protein [Dioszegia hungarica]KAI9632145.1 putative TAT-binding protein [Dioszegia hungarica]